MKNDDKFWDEKLSVGLIRSSPCGESKQPNILVLFKSTERHCRTFWKSIKFKSIKVKKNKEFKNIEPSYLGLELTPLVYLAIALPFHCQLLV